MGSLNTPRAPWGSRHTLGHSTGHCSGLIWEKSKITFIFNKYPSPPLMLQSEHKSQRIYLLPTWKGLGLYSKPGIFFPIRKTRNTPNVPVAPAGTEPSQIYSSGRQTPPAVGKVNLIHLSPSITDSALIQHIHCFSPSSDRKEPIAQARNQTSVSRNKDINLQVSVMNQ